MRAAFVEALVALAERDPRVCLITGDLGFSVLEPFAARFPDRFLNAGVAEQNMVGLATGMAEAGYVPFVYSIATFASMRPYEFIRNGPLLHELPVRIVGVGGGLDYGHNGVTHFALEDLAILRAQPGMTIFVPADGEQATAAVAASSSVRGPLYLRLERTATPISGLDSRFEIGRAQAIGDGVDAALISTGSIAHEAVEAMRLLAERGIDATVLIVSTFNPSPHADLVELLERTSLTVTVEEHYVTGGLGSFVSESVAELGLDCRVERRGVHQMPRGIAGTHARLREHFGLDASSLARVVAELTVAPR